MEIRKLQKVGSSTLSVSLPSGWASEVGLKRGASVQLIEDGRELRVIPLAEGPSAPGARPTAYLIDADECKTGEVLARVLVACYVLGRDHLVIRSKNRISSEQLEAARRIGKKLIGVGIMEETAEQVVLQCSLDTGRYPIDTLFKRLYNLSATAMNDSIEALRLKDPKLAHIAASREEDADMIYWLIMRLILSAQQDETIRTQIGLKSRADVAAYAIVAMELERIADQTRIMGTNAVWLIQGEVKLSAAIHNALRSHAQEVGELFANAMRALLSRELEKAVEATEQSARLWKGEETLILGAVQAIQNPEALLRVRRVIQALVLIEESCRQIAIVSFSRHQSEPTRFARPLDDRKAASGRSG